MKGVLFTTQRRQSSRESERKREKKKSVVLPIWFKDLRPYQAAKTNKHLGNPAQHNATTLGRSLTRATTINQSLKQGSSEEAQRTPFVAAVGMAGRPFTFDKL